jgi:hypothetical protein
MALEVGALLVSQVIVIGTLAWLAIVMHRPKDSPPQPKKWIKTPPPKEPLKPHYTSEAQAVELERKEAEEAE